MQRKKCDLIKTLCEEKVNSLIAPSIYGDLKRVKYLVKRGVSFNEINDALKSACCFAQLKIIKYLVEEGADIHVYNDRPLLNALYYGYFNVVKYLVEEGADIYTINVGSLYWSLNYSPKIRHLKIINYLIEEAKKKLINDLIISYLSIAQSSPQIRTEKGLKSQIPKQIIWKILYLAKYNELIIETENGIDSSIKVLAIDRFLKKRNIKLDSSIYVKNLRI